MIKKIRFVEDHIFIEKRGDIYIPYIDLQKATLRIASPSIMARYDQNSLKNAYEKGELKIKN